MKTARWARDCARPPETAAVPTTLAAISHLCTLRQQQQQQSQRLQYAMRGARDKVAVAVADKPKEMCLHVIWGRGNTWRRREAPSSQQQERHEHTKRHESLVQGGAATTLRTAGARPTIAYYIGS